MPDLSILIPSRHELFLRHTVEDVLKNIRGDTDVIVCCDGEWPIEPLKVHPRVHILRKPSAIGQRAATNECARISTAEYLCKLDAHCAISEGFDVALVESAKALGPDVTQIPRQYNLHVFDWRCEHCGRRTYQGPRPATCDVTTDKHGQPDQKELRTLGPGCHTAGPFERVIVWHAQRRLTEAWRFDSSMVFSYFGQWKDRVDAAAKKAGAPPPDIFDVMSCLGACWFLSRERYWALGGLDESHGSWGQMGTELACKSWLSGGRMVTNRRAWYSHMFRTKEGEDWGFPYPNDGAARDKARDYSRSVWLNDGWPQQVRTLRWLVEKFAPVPGWTPEAIAALPEQLSPRFSESAA